jgi:leucyl aminopeptidase
MGGVLAVGQGSKEESQFIILEYKGGSATEAPFVLVGKGVTFDSGGIDTKPHPYALDMMMDMSGGAAVITTTLIAAKLRLKKNIVALVPAVENMPSGESFRPGDVIKMFDGTTVEIGHTDAEGRLILADAIAYAKRYKPSVLIDVATLTGAAAVALGERATGLFTKNDALAKILLKAGEATGDVAWRLPLWEEYRSEIVGNVADIANVRTKGRDGVGGAITAATFVSHFAQDIERFAHLDMAPTMTATFDEHLAKGAKGSPVRLLVEVMKNL